MITSFVKNTWDSVRNNTTVSGFELRIKITLVAVQFFLKKESRKQIALEI